VIILDSDTTVLKHSDELFFIPSTPAAMPRAYWLDNPYIASHVMVIEPSTTEFQRIQKAISKAKRGHFDMEIVNKLYGSKCLVLPHQKYGLLSGEFRSRDHGKFHGRYDWDPVEAIREAHFVHYSDYPFPKPWVQASAHQEQVYRPQCKLDDGGIDDCQARYIWQDLYGDFKERRLVRSKSYA
jgi:alpha-N-acetylglucosamine transferase